MERKIQCAAKRIDGKEHPRILTQDLDRFLQLDHPNVMKILDIEKTENILWMMMPLCEFDLNKLYKTRDVPLEANIKIMKQITAGIKYLHSQRHRSQRRQTWKHSCCLRKSISYPADRF